MDFLHATSKKAKQKIGVGTILVPRRISYDIRNPKDLEDENAILEFLRPPQIRPRGESVFLIRKCDVKACGVVIPDPEIFWPVEPAGLTGGFDVGWRTEIQILLEGLPFDANPLENKRILEAAASYWAGERSAWPSADCFEYLCERATIVGPALTFDEVCEKYVLQTTTRGLVP